MRIANQALAAIAATVALNSAPCQMTTVSMAVTAHDGTRVGSICEPFACTPHDLVVDAGNLIVVEMHAAAEQPYILFAGAPSTACYTLPWVLGGITMEPPLLLVEVGLIQSTGIPGKCVLDTNVVKLEIPAEAPPGASLVLQLAAWPVMVDMPAFSRGVELTTR